MSGGWGGARPGSGPKPEGYEPPQEKVDLDRERAEHERVKRTEREFKLAILQKQYLPRAAQQQAAAIAVAVMTQSLRSVPDTLERAVGLTPAQAELAQQLIDAALHEVVAAFQAMTTNE
jgi:Protein of unknown function (DUF1441)